VASELSQLLFLIDTAYNRASWHGTNLRGSLRGVSPRQAAWRPGRRRHNIWELVVHAAYWKYIAWRRLTSGEKGSFPLEGSNWFARPQQNTLKAWRDDIALLDQTHRTLRTAIAGLRPRDLDRTPPRSKVSMRALVTGVAAHDVYHAGQIQLLKRLSTR
jgi:uncharacterized damage-inducible protein DinB